MINETVKSPAPLRRGAATTLAFGVCGISTVWVVLRYGVPLDAWTWGGLAVGVALGGTVWLGRSLKEQLVWALLPLAFQVYVHVPWKRWSLRDDHRGRRGVLVCGGLRFGNPGPNTALLEALLGPRQPEWRVCSLRDGDERVHNRNPVMDPLFPEILAVLPHDEARRQVARCLIEPSNLARVHQGMLLVCLWELGYPEGVAPETWWDVHGQAFEIAQDPDVAVRRVWGWREAATELAATHLRLGWFVRPQLHAVEHQELGSRGGDPEFAEARWAWILREEAQSSSVPWPPLGEGGD